MMSPDSEDTSPMPPDDTPSEPAALPTVSAVIPAYNAADTIERALDSVYAQTYPNIIEVIVVDDGSTDNTAQIIRDKYPDVILIQQENAGAAVARNVGVERATGELIAFLDADDEWLPEKTERQVKILGRHPAIDVLLCDVVQLAEGRSTIPASQSRNPGGEAQLTQLPFQRWWTGGAPRERFHIGCSTWLVASDAFAVAGSFDESLRSGEDFEFLLRLAGRGGSVWVLQELLVRYHVRHGSLSRGRGAFTRPSDLLRVRKMYSPHGEGWASDLLAPAEFRRAMAHYCWSKAWVLWRGGRKHEARTFLATALEYNDARGPVWVLRRLALAIPALLYPLVTPRNALAQARDWLRQQAVRGQE